MLLDQRYPDLIIDGCPNGCSNCAGIYINSTIGHKIICNCSCGHHKARRRTGHNNNTCSLDNPSFLKQSDSKRPISTSTVIDTDDSSASRSAQWRRLDYN